MLHYVVVRSTARYHTHKNCKDKNHRRDMREKQIKRKNSDIHLLTRQIVSYLWKKKKRKKM